MSQQQPIVVDTLSLSPQSGTWGSGAAVSISSEQFWKQGDVVYAIIANISNLTVSSIANGGNGLGSWALVTDGTTTATEAESTALEAELWAATATADGDGIITATMSGTAAAGTEIMTFALVGTKALADKVSKAMSASTVVAFPAATSVFESAQALSIMVTASSNNTPTPQAGYSLIGTTVNDNVLIAATLANAYTIAAGTSVTPPVSSATQSSGSPSVALTILLRSPIPAPTALTATYTAGVGITVSWTAPSGYTGTGYNIYKLTNASQNGVPRRLDPDIMPGNSTVPWGTTTYIDREVGYPPVETGDNVCSYYATTVNGIIESPASDTSSATWLG